MTIRDKVKCSICEQKYLLRISLGHSELQNHTFQCKECESNISTKVNIDFNNTTFNIEYVENCEKTNFKDHLFEKQEHEYIVVNLHPELLMPKEFMYDPSYSTNIEESRRLIGDNLIGVRDDFFDEKYALTKQYTYNLNAIEKNWTIIKVAWKMINNNKREHLIEKQLKRYKSNTYESSDWNFDEVLFDFNKTILFPIYIDKGPKFFQYFKETININNNEEYKKLIIYSKSSLFKENMKKFLDIYNNFFEIYNELKQVLIYVTTSQNIPVDYTATSHDFDKTKLFYGQLYEAYTSNVSFISLLHNIYNGRNFNQFLNMTLEQYLKKDKHGRCDNFKNSNEFDWFSEFITSKLRNASHHGNIELKDNMVIYKAGKSLNSYTMSYTRYLEICMQLFLRLVCLNQLQILALYLYEKSNK